MRLIAIATVAVLVGCQSPAGSPPTATSPVTTESTTTAPTARASVDVAGPNASVSGNAPSSARTLPALDLACKVDKDCALFEQDTKGATACCPGCEWKTANNASLGAFRAACTSSPPPMCPPIGCAMPIVTARCDSGKCRIGR